MAKKRVSRRGNEIQNRLRKETEEALGHEVDPKIYQLAKAKASVWMRNVYGGTDWEEFMAEGGCGVAFYYQECAAKVQDTMNRQANQKIHQL